MDFSKHLQIVNYLKNKIFKWKKIAIFFLIISIILSIKIFYGFNVSLLPSNYIANIKITSEIFEDDFRDEILQKIAQDDDIKAVIIDIDSPGGGIVGSEILFENLAKISQKKPIVVIMGSVAASGGYMAAIASDHIIAHNGTITGSIGVLMQSAEITEFAKKIGVKFNNYKSSALKASPSPFEKSSPEVDFAINESIIDSANFFYDLVKERRGKKLKKSQYSKIFDGRIFTGRQALNAGLIDQIGGKKEALAYLKSKNIDDKLSINKIEIIENKDRFFEKFFGFLPFYKNYDFSKKGMMSILK